MPTYYEYDVVVTRKVVEEQKTFRVTGEDEETAGGAAMQHAKAAAWADDYEYVVESCTIVPTEEEPEAPAGPPAEPPGLPAGPPA